MRVVLVVGGGGSKEGVGHTVSVSTYYLPYNRFTDSSQARQTPAVDDPRIPLAAPPSTKVAEGSAASSSTLHLLSSGRTGRQAARSASERLSFLDYSCV